MSIIFCGLVLASFALFARAQVAGASKHQQAELVAGNQVTGESIPAVEAKHQPGKFIEQAAGHLESPFTSVVSSTSDWVNHIVPTVLALLVYGVGLGFVARYSRGLA